MPGAKGSQLGLDELMIVNPAPGASGGTFLGDDGTLYQVQGLDDEEHLQGFGQLFLGDDGTLYRAESVEPARSVESARAPARGVNASTAPELDGYLLAADGTLYEVTE
jgi:hypothetical protein